MLVLAAVSGIQFHKLRRAAAARFAVVHASSWDAVLAAIRSRPVELAVVDPLLTGTASDREIERLRVLFPSLPLILYTSLTPQTAAVLLALGQRGIRRVVFTRYDDHPTHLRHVLAQEEARPTSQQRRTYLGVTGGERRRTRAPEAGAERVVQGFFPGHRAQASVS